MMFSSFLFVGELTPISLFLLYDDCQLRASGPSFAVHHVLAEFGMCFDPTGHCLSYIVARDQWVRG